MKGCLVRFHRFRLEPCAVVPDLEVIPGDMVICKISDGEDMGRVMKIIESDEPVGVVMRKAVPEEIKDVGKNRKKAEEGMEVFKELLQEFKLPMKLIDAHCRWDEKKIAFYFFSPQRLNFRTFHKALSQRLCMGVAIKQIGVRDYTKYVGGLGPCGRELCCHAFFSEMRHITLRMAREQNLYVSPLKITGACGKLLCCLAFERVFYQESLKRLPKIGSIIETKQGKGKIVGFDIFNSRVVVRLGMDYEIYLPLEEVKEVEKRDERA